MPHTPYRRLGLPQGQLRCGCIHPLFYNYSLQAFLASPPPPPFKILDPPLAWLWADHKKKPVPLEALFVSSAAVAVVPLMIVMASSSCKQSSSRGWDVTEQLILGFDFGCLRLKWAPNAVFSSFLHADSMCSCIRSCRRLVVIPMNVRSALLIPSFPHSLHFWLHPPPPPRPLPAQLTPTSSQ